MCEVFVSSNLDSIHAGHEWNQIIKENLQKCSILVGLLSNIALTRGWVYAEFGAGWIRGIPTIPVCHSGLDRGNLPAPISAFQGLQLSDPLHLAHLYKLIAEAVGCQAPHVNFQERTTDYTQITEALRTRRIIVDWGRQLSDWNPTLLESLKSGSSSDDVLVPANLDQSFQEFVKEAGIRKYLNIKRAGMAMGTRVGAQASVFQISPGEKIDAFLASLA